MKKLIAFILILLQINLIGCVSTQAVSSEYLKNDQTKPLRIEMKDGNSIRLASGSYRIMNNEDSVTITGSGIRINRAHGNSNEPFAGTIRSNEISYIEIVEPSVFVYALPIYIGVVTAIGLILLLSFNGRTVGG